MRDVAVVGFTQSPSMRSEPDRNEVEILIPVIDALRKQTGLTSADMDFICSGSSDYLAGSSFAFVSGLDAVGAWPPVCESHVEMDGAWALYEAWVKIQMGYADTALVYGFGKPSMGDLPITMALQLDPYSVMPLWPDTLSIAGLQARHCLEKGILTFEQMAAAAARDHAFGALGWETAVSYIDPDNIRSVALAERLGARHDPEARGPGENSCLVYRHPRPEAHT